MKKFEITKEQILEIAETSNMATHIFLGLFPDAFKTKFTGWAKDIHEFNKKWIAYYENDVMKYGISASGYWFKPESNANYNEYENDREATEQEVETALINEAKKRGLIDWNYIKATNGDYGLVNDGIWVYDKNVNKLYYAGFILFDNGKWATITPTKTKEEAEKLLGVKIIS